MKLGSVLNEINSFAEVRKVINMIFPNAQANGLIFGTNVKHGDANELRGTQAVFMDSVAGDLNLPTGMIQGHIQCYDTNVSGVGYLSQIALGEGLAGTQSRVSVDSGATWTAWA